LIAGAHDSVQAQQRRSPRAPAAVEVVKIRVRADDSITAIPERYNVRREELAQLNNRAVDAGLQPGEEIYIPAVATTSSSAGEHVRHHATTIAGIDNDLRMRAQRVEPAIASAATRYGVDPRVLWTIAFLETRFQPGLVSVKGARGLMQFMPGTAARYGLRNPHDANAAIDAAARYVRDLARRFNNRFELVLASYNAGEGAVEAYLKGVSLRTPDGRVINPNRIRAAGGIPPYTETREYVARGLLIARGLTTANVFSPALMERNTLLSLPSGLGTMTSEMAAEILSENRTPPLLAPEFITPTSSYALSRTKAASVEKKKGQPSSQSNRFTGAVIARSYRASATTQPDESTTGDKSNANPSPVSMSAPVTIALQPRSTYINAAGRQR